MNSAALPWLALPELAAKPASSTMSIYTRPLGRIIEDDVGVIAAAEPTTVAFTLTTRDGAERARREMQMAAWQSFQRSITELFGIAFQAAELENGSLRVEVIRGGPLVWYLVPSRAAAREGVPQHARYAASGAVPAN